MKLIHRVVLAAVLLISSSAVNAQQLIQLGLTGGVSFSFVSGYKTDIAMLGYQGAAKALIDFRPVQFGVGIEGGHIKGNAADPFYVQSGRTEMSRMELAGIYRAPHVFVNGKLNVSNRAYFFAGGMYGMMWGRSLMIKDNFSSSLYGANLGFVVNLSEHMGLEIAEGWRRVKVEGVYENIGTYRYYFPDMPIAYTINYLTTSIGLRIRFGSNENKWYR